MKSLSANLSENILQLRNKRGITQEQVAKLAGVPRSTIALMESGEGNPTLQNLARLAAALQIGVEELLSAPRAANQIIKSKDLPRTKKSQGTTIIQLLPDPIPGMVIDRMEIETGGRMGGVPHIEGTKEYFTCIQGEVTVYVSGERYVVQEGDVLVFPGNQAHSYNNTGNKKAVSLSVVVLAPRGI